MANCQDGGGSERTTPRHGLARALSKLGHCSRAHAVELIREGRVWVDGHRARDPEFPVRAGKTVIEVDGKRIGAATHAYLMMNKPRGLVTSTQDEKGRATVYSLLPANSRWLAPVGRLDKASEGLLLFTNDPQWAARITSPDSHISKTYHVQIAAVADEEMLARLRKGVMDGGELLRVATVRVIRCGSKNSWLELVLEEGRNRQIRRMFEGVGIEVLRLVRVAIGDLQLGEVPKGGVRELAAKEVRHLARSGKSS